MPNLFGLPSLTGLGADRRFHHPGNELPGYCLSSLTGLMESLRETPAMNCRAIVCRPQRDWLVKKQGMLSRHTARSGSSEVATILGLEKKEKRGLVLASATFKDYRPGSRHSGRSGIQPGCR